MTVGTEFVDILIEFGDELRDAGIAVGTGDAMTYVEAVSLLNPLLSSSLRRSPVES